jgi:hypothetical protein
MTAHSVMTMIGRLRTSSVPAGPGPMRTVTAAALGGLVAATLMLLLTTSAAVGTPSPATNVRPAPAPAPAPTWSAEEPTA